MHSLGNSPPGEVALDRAQLEQSFRLTRIGVARRRLCLSRPLATGSATYRRRTVFVLEVDLDVGERSVRGFGEASPLSEWAGSVTEDRSRPSSGSIRSRVSRRRT